MTPALFILHGFLAVALLVRLSSGLEQDTAITRKSDIPRPI